MSRILFIMIALFCVPLAAAEFESDTLQTSQGDLVMTFIGHGTLCFTHNDKIVHVDPWTRLADYEMLPDADVILLTHHHGDHLDTKAIEAVRTEETRILLTQTCSETVSGTVLENGDTETVYGIQVRAVPAYNIKHMRNENQPYHPKGVGNGYVITFADKTVYVAGDTEDIPEMALLKGQVDVAFLPMNLPYTMSPDMAAHAAKMVQPDILYPYHFGDTDVQQLVDLLKDTEMDIRIRNMQ